MNEYQVSDYAIFSKASDTTKNYITKIEDSSTVATECKTILSSEDVFMGPVADCCKQEFIALKQNLTSLSTDFNSISQFVLDVDANYKKGDNDALNTMMQATEAAGNGLVTTSTLGSDYNIANTKMSFTDFYKNVVQGKQLYQKSGGYHDWCLGFACTHAWGMYSNTSDYKASECNNSCAATNHFKRYKTNDEKDYMNKIYNEISNGRPVVIQVIGSKSKGTRHYVTAVGFKNNVTSGSQLKDTDLLIVDSYDGNVENIVAKGSSGDGRYIIKGTDTSNYKKGNKNYNYGYELYSIV